jgi:hypothetical protein
VLKVCRPKFASEEAWSEFLNIWTQLTNAGTASCFDFLWIELQRKYGDIEDLVPYLQRTWLPWKERFVKAWADTCLHLGCRTTSRVEGAHSALKSYIQVSTGDLFSVQQKMNLAIENQMNRLDSLQASSKTRIPLHVRNQLLMVCRICW